VDGRLNVKSFVICQYFINFLRKSANLEATNLAYADLRGADLRGANLENANLNKSCYNSFTVFDKQFQPQLAGMREVKKSKYCQRKLLI